MRRLCIVLIAMLCLSGCGNEYYKDDRVYIVDRDQTHSNRDQLVDWLEADGPNIFTDVALPHSEDTFVLFKNKDGRTYSMREAYSQRSTVRTLIGTYDRPMNLYAEEANGNLQLLAQGIPFIHKVQQSEEGDWLFLQANQVVYTLDIAKNLLRNVNEATSQACILNFFVSPLERNKLYVDSFEIEGGLAFYPASNKSVALYQTWGSLAYKNILDVPYYYATQWRRDRKAAIKDSLFTVVADASGQVVRILGVGNFQDAYKDQVLLVGNNRFGLTYVPSFNRAGQSVKLSAGYIYDARILRNGEIAWVEDSEPAQSNQLNEGVSYALCIADQEGNLLERYPFSGAHFYLSSDGRMLFGSGLLHEQYDVMRAAFTKEEGSVIEGRNEPFDRNLLGFVEAYAKARFGDEQAANTMQQWLASPEVLNLGEIPKQDAPLEDIHLEARYQNLQYNWNGVGATLDLVLQASEPHGRVLHERFRLGIAQYGDGWRIWHIERLA